MRTNIVLTLTGTDRVGIVHDITELLLSLSGNVEASHMARLGGEFAMLMLVSIPSEQLANLDEATGVLAAQGYKVTTTRTTRPHTEICPDGSCYQIEVRGADHQGVLNQVAHYLSQRGINIETLEGKTARAPISGTPLFSLVAHVVVPPSLPEQDWMTGLEDIGQHLNVDIAVSAAEKRYDI
ncbi:MAG: transcriptional regulator [Anaerolineae bacterium]|nr:transcriptional regulator [Anaerolineae bacterium]